MQIQVIWLVDYIEIRIMMAYPLYVAKCVMLTRHHRQTYSEVLSIGKAAKTKDATLSIIPLSGSFCYFLLCLHDHDNSTPPVHNTSYLLIWHLKPIPDLIKDVFQASFAAKEHMKQQLSQVKHLSLWQVNWSSCECLNVLPISTKCFIFNGSKNILTTQRYKSLKMIPDRWNETAVCARVPVKVSLCESSDHLTFTAPAESMKKSNQRMLARIQNQIMSEGGILGFVGNLLNQGRM